MPTKAPLHSNKQWTHRPTSETLLARWSRESGVSLYSIARKISCDRTGMRALASGRRLPSLLMAFKIQQVTEGAVPAASWLDTDIARARWSAVHVDENALREQRNEERNRRRRRTRGT